MADQKDLKETKTEINLEAEQTVVPNEVKSTIKIQTQMDHLQTITIISRRQSASSIWSATSNASRLTVNFFRGKNGRPPVFTPYCLGFTAFVLICGVIFIPVHIFILNSEDTEEVCKLNKNVLGNGYCNDDANKEVCNFDHGDCCLPYVNKTFCTSCLCQETLKVYVDPPHPERGLWYKELTDNQCIISWLGDKICQNVNNYKLCHYDAGDCCIRTAFSSQFCSDCTCNHKDTDHDKYCLKDFTPIGNGECDMEYNYQTCYFDGGDCSTNLTSVSSSVA